LVKTAIDQVAEASPPPAPQTPPPPANSTASCAPDQRPRWTLARLVSWLEEARGCRYSDETIRQALHRLGFSWKKARKLLAKADPEARQEFLVTLAHRLQDSIPPVVVYCDEAHVHQDADGGYGWGLRGKTFWIRSSSPGLAKVTFYGLYLVGQPQPIEIWPYPRGNTEATIDMLRRLRARLPGRKILLIWDGASYHRSEAVLQEARVLDFQLLRLPAYSPDLMPVEALWRWLRQEVTYHRCHHSAQELRDRVESFRERINQSPDVVARRLRVKSQLHPEEENLRFWNMF
jgi:transposase